jgi:transglutaminase-like putative cysteine protease
MAKLARQGLQDQQIRNLAVELTTAGFLNGTGLQQKDFFGEARRLLAFVRDDIRYVKDTDGVELLHDPVTLLQTGAGDCDDKAILLAALLGSIGHQTRFVAMAQQPDFYGHVWLQDNLNGQWVDLEPTEPIPFGQSVPIAPSAKLIYQDV